MIETSTSIKNIDKKIFLIQSVAPVINKDGVNPHFKSKYAEYPEIQAVIRPLLIDNGILVSFMPVHGNMLTMYVKDTDSAEFYKVTADLNTVGVSPQAQGSAITYLKRYMITAFFDLQIDDASDDDGNSGSGAVTKPATQAKTAPVRPVLSPETKDVWNHTIFSLRAGKLMIENVFKQYTISEEDKEKLKVLAVKANPKLKQGTDAWNNAVRHLAIKPGAKIDDLSFYWTLTAQDVIDLQEDALNYEEPQTANTTK